MPKNVLTVHFKIVAYDLHESVPEISWTNHHGARRRFIAKIAEFLEELYQTHALRITETQINHAAHTEFPS